VYAINATIDTAIAQRQAEGGDTSALTGLKMQMDGALSGAGQGQTFTPAQQITTQAETSVSALQALPPSVKAKIGYDGVFNALLSAQMNAGNVELAQAALEKVRAGVEAAMETEGLDVGTRETLVGVVDNR
jgi:hypothetical protein